MNTSDDVLRPSVAATASPVLVALLTAVTALGSISVSLYVPSLPAIASDLSASAWATRLTLTTFLTAFAVSQLAYGPLSDRYGRRNPLLIGAGIYVAGSLACLMASTIDALIAARMLQAIGAAAGPALSRAMVRDSVAPDRLAGIMAMMASVIALSPTLGPALGGQIQAVAGWRADFVALALVGLALGGSMWWKLPETLTSRSTAPLSVRGVVTTYWTLMSDRCFLVFLLCGGLLTAGNFAWVAAAPFLFIQKLGISAASYGLYNLLVGGGYALGALLVIFGGHRFSTRQTVFGGAMLGMLGTGTLLSVAMILPHALPLAGAMALYACGMGIAVPSSAAGALARHPEAAGSAAALIGGMQIGIGALGSMVGSLVQPYGAPGLALVVLMGSIAATACLLGINGIKSDHPTLAQRHDVATAHIGG